MVNLLDILDLTDQLQLLPLAFMFVQNALRTTFPLPSTLIFSRGGPPPKTVEKQDRPRGIICYVCGREFFERSFKIHLPQCLKKVNFSICRSHSIASYRTSKLKLLLRK